MYRFVTVVAVGLIAATAQAGTTAAPQGQASAKAPAPAKVKKICKNEETATGSIMRRRVCYTQPQADTAPKEARGQQGSNPMQDAGGR